MYSKIIKIFIKCKFFDLATQWELLEFYRQLFLINSPDITQLFLETLPDVLMYLNKDATICGSGLKQKLSRTALTPIYLLVYSIALKPLDLCKKINEIQKKMFKDKSTTALFVKLLLNCFKKFRKLIFLSIFTHW